MLKPTYCVSPSEIEEFETRGVVCLRNVLNPSEIRSLAEGIDEIIEALDKSAAGYDATAIREQIFETAAPAIAGGEAKQYDITGLAQMLRAVGAKPLMDEVPEQVKSTGHFRLDTTTWKRNAAIRSLVLDSVLPDVAAQLLRASKINYSDDQVFVKEPGTKDRTAFHQDYTYFHMKGRKGCVMWVCVDPANEESGATVYIPGSHLWGREFKANVFLAQTAFPGSEGEDLPDIEGNLEDYELVRFETQPGDIIIHHFRTVHGAGGNCSTRQRRAISLRYSGEDMRFHNRRGAPPQPYHHHELQEGDPLDSQQFPVVWPKPWPGYALAPAYDTVPGEAFVTK
jgi:ectoine hydroxylase-related dioxygenase (phytanoyl-CoA dioxygenase family)